MAHANPKKVALALGFIFAGIHLVWSLLVWFGVGQWAVNFIMWAHMVHIEYVVGPFDLTACITLIVLTFCVGYVIGQGGARVWNKVHRS